MPTRPKSHAIILDLQPLRDALAAAKVSGKGLKERHLISKYVPGPSVDYVMAWYLAYPFLLEITKPRESRYGDYRPLPPSPNNRGAAHKITVNGNLPPQAFLLTYLHEVAHMMVIRLIPHRVSAHGVEWKSIFSQMLQPMLRPEVFDPEVLPAMIVYAKDPKASSATDPDLMRALHFGNMDDGAEGALSSKVKPLMDYQPSAGFRFKLKGRTFEVEEKARTTYLCKEIKTGKLYKVKGMAPVEALQ